MSLEQVRFGKRHCRRHAAPHIWVTSNAGGRQRRPPTSRTSRGLHLALRRLFLLQEQFALFTPHVMSRACSRWLPTQDCAKDCIHHGRAAGAAAGVPGLRSRRQLRAAESAPCSMGCCVQHTSILRLDSCRPSCSSCRQSRLSQMLRCHGLFLFRRALLLHLCRGSRARWPLLGSTGGLTRGLLALQTCATSKRHACTSRSASTAASICTSGPRALPTRALLPALRARACTDCVRPCTGCVRPCLVPRR